MSKNTRDLLKEAILDARTIRETAIQNAKLALQETFTPALRETLASKLEEMDNEEDVMESAEVGSEEGKTAEQPGKPEGDDQVEDLNLDELLAELDETEDDATVAEGEASENLPQDSEDLPQDAETLEEAEEGDEPKEKKEPVKKAESKPKAKAAPKKDDKKDESMDLDEMDEEDLKKFIEEVVAEMVETGELEDSKGGKPVHNDESDMTPEMGAAEHNEDEEVNLDELLAEVEGEELSMDNKETGTSIVKEYGTEHELTPEEALAKICEEHPEIEYCKGITEATKKELAVDSKETGYKKDLMEAYKTINLLKKEFKETNLFNAKLLYANKIFKAKNNLTESQKVKILNSFDKAKSTKDAKLIYETLINGIKEKPVKFGLNESLMRSFASKVTPAKNIRPIVETDVAFARMQKLAGIK